MLDHGQSTQADRDEFIAALGRLPEPGQTVLRLVFHEDLDFTRVARRLKITEPAVRSIARRALVDLRTQLTVSNTSRPG